MSTKKLVKRVGAGRAERLSMVGSGGARGGGLGGGMTVLPGGAVGEQLEAAVKRAQRGGSGWRGAGTGNGSGSDGRMEYQRAVFGEVYSWKDHWYVGGVVEMWMDLLLAGARWVPRDLPKVVGDEGAKGLGRKWVKAQEEVDGWSRKARRHWWKGLQDVARDMLLCQAAVVFWRGEPSADGKGLLALPLDGVDYSDDLALELLTIRREGLCEAARKVLPGPVYERWRKGEVKLGTPEWEAFNDKYPQYGEHFAVLRRERAGGGLGTPLLRGCLHALLEAENLEVGEQRLSGFARSPREAFLIGHEKRANVAYTMAPEWTEKRSEQVKKMVGKEDGARSLAVNHDVKRELWFMDPAHFRGDKWESVLARLMWWGGPVGMMLMTKSVTPHLHQLMVPQLKHRRREIGWFLEEVVGRTMEPPGDGVRLEFDESVYHTERVVADYVKHLSAKGSMSAATLLGKVGGFLQSEVLMKAVEQGLEADMPGVLTPVYDANHGGQPGVSAVSDANGEPADGKARRGRGKS